MTAAPETAYAVVFQMGKVASTAITAALDGLPGVTAVQSHFLGPDALCKVLNMAIEPNNSEYFFGHQLGQLQQNITCTRHINRIRAGVDPRRLVILSLARDPFSWFRSSVVQDIEGYADTLSDLGGAQAGRDARVSAGLVRFLDMAAERIEAHPDVDTYRQALRSRAPGAWEGLADWPHLRRQLLLSAMMPADWYAQHFGIGLGVRLEQLQRHGQVWRHEDGPARFAVIRYEDLATAFPEVCGWAFGQVPDLSVENASDSKPLSGVIADAFATPAGARLNRALMNSNYARHFGYAGPAAAAAPTMPAAPCATPDQKMKSLEPSSPT